MRVAFLVLMRASCLVAAVVLIVTVVQARPAAALIVTAADLAVDLTDSRYQPSDPVTAGKEKAPLIYFISVRNGGPSDAQNVTVTDATPAHTTFSGFDQTSGPAFTLSAPAPGGTGTAVATIALLPAGASATLELMIYVDADAAEGSFIVDTASVRSDTNDPLPANNSATDAIRVVRRRI